MSHELTHWAEVPHAPPCGTFLAHRDDVADGQAVMRAWPPEGDAPSQFAYLMLRSGDTIRAYVNRCAHFGVPLAQKQVHLIYQPHRRITCNVHYAHYDWHDGHCLGGECAGTGLLPVPVSVDADGNVFVAPAT
jgi:nitrite reductase/ring-hydroxylating ferredoxin subunit